MNTIVLTDLPRIVELKREFRTLDEQVETLKNRLARTPCDWLARAELERCTARKQEIAQQVFLAA